MWLAEQFLKLVNVFEEARKNSIFMVDNAAFKLKKRFAHVGPSKECPFNEY
jgi:hypothetical protein